MSDTFNILRRVAREARCKPGWSFEIVEELGALRLVITVEGVNSYAPHRPFTLRHFHPVPTTTYNEQSWRRWVFEQCLRTEVHEIGEWLRWDDERPFAPLHGPGEDPYTVHEYRDDEDRRTTQDGSVRCE